MNAQDRFYDAFLDPRCSVRNLDLYTIRKRILAEVKAGREFLSGSLLDVGCGRMPYRALLSEPEGRASWYLGIDLYDPSGLRPDYGTPDLYWDGLRIPLSSDAFDCALAVEVLEHCPDPRVVMSEIYRVLKPGGHLLVTVPFLWPLHDAPFDEYRYTPFSLERHATEAGFQVVHIRALGGWDASLAQMLGLWVRHRSMNRILRRVLTLILLPFIRLLDGLDDRVRVHGDSAMISSIGALVVKPPSHEMGVPTAGVGHPHAT